jgi:hypothetical protein
MTGDPRDRPDWRAILGAALDYLEAGARHVRREGDPRFTGVDCEATRRRLGADIEALEGTRPAGMPAGEAVLFDRIRRLQLYGYGHLDEPRAPDGTMGSLEEDVRAALARLPAPGGTEAATPPRAARRGPGYAPDMIGAALDSLIARREWGWSNSRIARLARVPSATYYRALKKDPGVRRKMAEYRRQYLGRGPTDPSEL